MAAKKFIVYYNENEKTSSAIVSIISIGRRVTML